MTYSPSIKFRNDFWTQRIEDPDEVREYMLPNTQFKFVHEIYDKEREKVQPKLGKGGNEGTLNAQSTAVFHMQIITSLTRVGVYDSDPITPSTAFELTTYPCS